MKRLILSSIAILVLGIINCSAQSSGDVQPVSSARDAVMAPAAVITPADSATVIIDSKRDAQPVQSGAAEVPAGDAGQPVPAVRKPD